MNKFFDFHCHPGLKPMFAKPGERPSPWKNIKSFVRTPVGHIELNPLFNEVLDSQSSLQQLYNGNVNLIGLAICSPESNMGKSLWAQSMVREGNVTVIWPEVVERIKRGESYFEMTKEEIRHLLDAKNGISQLPGSKLKFIRSYADYDPNDINTIHAFLVIEGMHSFSPDEASTNDWDRLKANFIQFISNNTYRVFAVNICHLQQNKLCNHAHGIQFFNPEMFYPTGETFSDSGLEMVRTIYNNNVLVDIKHMSLAARIAFYRLVNAEFPSKPILCTHAGVTGLRMDQRLKYIQRKPQKSGPTWKVSNLKPQGYLDHSYFNCSSINLYDEDIVRIMGSKGLIGISLDQRILGFGAAFTDHWVVDPVDTEHISENEAGLFFGPAGPAGIPVTDHDSDVLNGEELQNQASAAAIGDIHMRYFFNNVMHILKVIVANGGSFKQASELICLGTDFDGLIDAIECCKNAEEIGDFYQMLLPKLPGFFREAGYNSPPIDPEKLLDNIFYENGRRFLEKNFL